MSTTTQTTNPNTQTTKGSSSTESTSSPLLTTNAASALLAFALDISHNELECLVNNNEMSQKVLENNQDLIGCTLDEGIAAAKKNRRATLREADGQMAAGVLSCVSAGVQAGMMAGSAFTSYGATNTETELTTQINEKTTELNEFKRINDDSPAGTDAGIVQEVAVRDDPGTSFERLPPERQQERIAAKQQEIDTLENKRAMNRQTSRSNADNMMYLSQITKAGFDGASNIVTSRATHASGIIKEQAAADTAVAGFYNSQSNTSSALLSALNNASANQKEAAANILSVAQG